MRAWTLKREVVVSFLPVKCETPISSEKYAYVNGAASLGKIVKIQCSMCICKRHAISLAWKFGNRRPDWKIKRKETCRKLEETFKLVLVFIMGFYIRMLSSALIFILRLRFKHSFL